MQLTLTISRMLVRITGVLLLILGLLIWVEKATNLIMIHMLLGLILVISMWVLAGVSTRAGVSIGLAASVAIAGLIVLVLGVTQQGLLPDPSVHWIVQIVHLVVGMLAVGSAEAIGGTLKRTRTPALSS
jgi:hypothetical protein